ncbi:MAG: ABC transporter substrate-binding protein [Hyphomicrobiales bacterium]|nr:ABC transporter substrate-binding protein [Hyphomicrobiales bacterium]
MMSLRWTSAVAGAFSFFLALSQAQAQAPRANGETINIQQYMGTTGNMHAFVAAKKGFCEKYNFHCELKIINSGILGLQTLVGKSIDIAETGTDLTAATINAGGDVVIVGTAINSNVLFVVAREDVPLPDKDKGYPAIVKDLKGLKIGVPARGAAAEVYMNVMLRDAGLTDKDVTYVAVGGPQTGYTSLVVGKQVDAAILFEPLKSLCLHTKKCKMVVDMLSGEGPAISKLVEGAGVPLVARREFVEKNPKLMEAFYAAMRDAAAWMNDPKNFDELDALYKPTLSFSPDIPDADKLRRDWLKSSIPAYSKTLAVNRQAVKATIDFGIANKTLDKPVDVKTIVWDKAP